MYTREDILEELEENKRFYDLIGVELTEEDANFALALINKEGYTKEHAIQTTLIGIAHCLEEYC